MATEQELRDYLRRAAVDLTESRRRVAELEAARHEPVAVVGMACRLPGGADSPAAFWDLLQRGGSGTGAVPHERFDISEHYDPDRTAGRVYTDQGAFLDDIAGWDADLFGVPPAEALRMDPHQRLLMELTWETLEDAGIPAGSIAGRRVAVLIGSMDSTQYGRLQYTLQGEQVAHEPYFGQGAASNMTAGRLAYHFDLRGPAVTMDSACSSSLVGVHQGITSLRRGECDLALAGGASLVLTPDVFVQACATSQLSPAGACHTFDASADGYLMGEGGGLVLLERLSDAVAHGRRIHGVLRGSAVNQDGHSNGLTAPRRGAQVEVIRDALDDAGLVPGDIDLVEAHGSATSLGDAIELGALHDVFGHGPRRAPLHVGAVKTNIGHTQAAAGIAGLIKTLLSLQHRRMPVNLHFSEPAQALPADGSLDPVVRPTELGDDAVRAGVSSFGWSGTNAHVVVETAPAAPPAVRSAAADSMRPEHLVPLSAAHPDSLADHVSALHAWAGANGDVILDDAAHTLARLRTHHGYRRAVVARAGTDDSPLGGLRDALGAEHRMHRVHASPRVAFLFQGTGDQYVGLGRDLYGTEPGFAAAVEECLALLVARCDLDLRHLLLEREPTRRSDSLVPASDDLLDDPALAHPIAFVVEYALATTLLAAGVRPQMLVGYSLGEYIAATVAGVFDLGDALEIVVERARLIGTAEPGAMLAVAAGSDAVHAAITSCGAAVEVAAVNGPALTIASGTPSGVEQLAELLVELRLPHRRVRTSAAFHSSLLAPVRDKLAALLDRFPRRPPTIRVVSNTTGRPLTASEATSSAYWADHLVEPVRLADALSHCLAEGVDIVVEIGAGQSLGTVVQQDPNAAHVCVVPTLAGRDAGTQLGGERRQLLTCLGRLWECGVDLDWEALAPTGTLVGVPGYAYRRTRYWPETTRRAEPAAAEPVLDAPPADLCYTGTWRRDPAVSPGQPGLAGPLLVITGTATHPLASELVAHARAAGVQARVVDADADDLTAGLTTDADHPVHAVVLSGVAEADAQHAGLSSRAYLSLLRLLQQAGDHPGGLRLVTVSKGGAEVVGGDLVAPFSTSVHGLGRAARHELGPLTWHGVDLDPRGTDDEAARLWHEVGSSAAGTVEPGVVAWRGGRRWLPDHAPVPTSPGPGPWRHDGHYLITGGSRGLGRALADHLVAAGVRRLTLVSRSASATDVTALENAGVEVLLLDADTARPDQLGRALATARRRLGPLTGVVHAAGVPASGMVQRQRPETVEAVLGTKLGALAPLGDLVAGSEPPELVVLYSSALTSLGGIGEADYCAANTVLDAYAQHLDATSDATHVVSVAWGPWLHDVWQTPDDATEAGPGNELARRAGDYRRRFGFGDDAGCRFLDALLATGLPHVVAVRQPLEVAAAQWADVLDLAALTAAATTAPTGPRHPRPDLRVAYAAPRTELEGVIAEVWQRFLGLDRVGVDDPFFDLGGNSLVGMSALLDLGHRLGRTIAPALLFAHPTVAQLAAALEPPDLATRPAPAASDVGERGRRRRRARQTRKEFPS
ncbi:type I polyketide synthase [Nocardioides sp. GXZ039]|uniref:type I polyketide synthase n=1 Tax=Nocardioides sp. GXZ039 TaxID=3136018 RepID=UPI0030F471A8